MVAKNNADMAVQVMAKNVVPLDAVMPISPPYLLIKSSPLTITAVEIPDATQMVINAN